MHQAILFDIDGTLVDSVDLHAQAWAEAFAKFDRHVPAHQLRPHIGKGSDQLLPVFFSVEELARFGDELDAYRGDLYRKRYFPQVRPFPGVRPLFLKLREHGVQIALASSAKGAELQRYKELVEVSDLVDEQSSSEDAKRSKPHPDIFRAALQRLGQVDPTRVAVVGDTPYDAFGARSAGCGCVGVLSGGFTVHALLEAGCHAVYRDPLHLLATFPQWMA